MTMIALKLLLSLLPIIGWFLLFSLPSRVRFWVSVGSLIPTVSLLVLANSDIWPAVPAASWAVVTAFCVFQAILAACCRLVGLFGCLSFVFGWVPFLIALNDPGQFFEASNVKSQIVDAEHNCRTREGPEISILSEAPGYVVSLYKRLPYLPGLEKRVSFIWSNRDRGVAATCADVVARYHATLAVR
jgi:hypothetical protein